MRKLLVAAAVTGFATPAMAQDAPPQDGLVGVPGTGLDISVEANALSDYRFRGVSRSDEDPALQGAVTLSHDSGFYVGGRGTTLKGFDSFRLRDPDFDDLGDVELDLYAGYRKTLGAGFDLDAGALYYVFTGGEGPTDYVEPYASLSYLFGPIYATAGAKYAPAQDAIGDEDMLYLFGQADVSVPFTPFTFTAIAGHQEWGRFGEYWNWSLGGRYALGPADIGVAYVDTDLPAVAGQDAGVVLSLGLRF